MISACGDDHYNCLHVSSYYNLYDYDNFCPHTICLNNTGYHNRASKYNPEDCGRNIGHQNSGLRQCPEMDQRLTIQKHAGREDTVNKGGQPHNLKRI